MKITSIVILLSIITSDLPGTYLVTVEGIGLKGTIVRGCCTISVEE